MKVDSLKVNLPEIDCASYLCRAGQNCTGWCRLDHMLAFKVKHVAIWCYLDKDYGFNRFDKEM